MADRVEYVYDEDASKAHHMDVVREVVHRDEESASKAWVESMRRLNSITDPLARKILALHRECGSGTGECDCPDDVGQPGLDWPCETTGLVADHFGVEYP
jgi:hypothetical protein